MREIDAGNRSDRAGAVHAALRRCALAACLLAGSVLAACSVGGDVGTEARQVALDFTRALTEREYARAHAMTTAGYRQATSAEALRRDFEAVVPTDWGDAEPLEVAATLGDWPDREPDDVGLVSVAIPGDVYSEAIAVVVAREAGVLRIRSVEMGRP